MSTFRERVPRICPSCDKAVDCNTALIEDAPPRDGDWSICAGCSSILVITNHTAGGLRLATQEEIDASEMKPMLIRAQELLTQIRKRPT